MSKYEYNIFPENNPQEFRAICSEIERVYPKAKKEKLNIDVDGTTIQIYYIYLQPKNSSLR